MADSKSVGEGFNTLVETAPKLLRAAKILLFVCVALIVLVVVLEIQVQRRNEAIDRIEASTERSEKAAARAEEAGEAARVAALKASKDLQAAVERGQDSGSADATARALVQIDEIHQLLVEEQP